jgi:DNA recombination protein RmuC
MDKDGDAYRADMVIHFHGKRYLVVDSKAPMAAFEETLLATSDKEEKAKLRKYSTAIRKHVGELSTKKYWSNLNEKSPEFVIAFLACEAFYSTALKEDPGLIEYCLEKKVVLASPVTLIALLKVIEFGWRQEVAEKNIDEIKSLMREQYSRTLLFSEHFSALGKSLQTAVKKYNDGVGSFESRLLSSTRKMKDIGGIVGDDIPENQPMNLSVRVHNPPGGDNTSG